MKIYHFSDPHGHHEMLNDHIPTDADMIICSGDVGNDVQPGINQNEVTPFLDWFGKLPHKYKMLVAGNHDTSIEKRLITRKDIEDRGIIYLECDHIVIDGVKFYGSPYTPPHGNTQWSFTRKRGKFDVIYNGVDKDVDVFVTHGPPFGILDLSYRRDGSIELCGCREMRNMINRCKPKLVLFGHIHSTKDLRNAGVRTESGVTYSNGSIVDDGKFGKITSTGNFFDLNDL